MKPRKVLKVLLFAVIASVVFGFVVMGLWNRLIPPIIGWQAIGFWQALGILVLSRILFGGFPGRHGGGPWRRRMMERWAQMTPEEQEKFRAGLRRGWGPTPPPTTEPKA